MRVRLTRRIAANHQRSFTAPTGLVDLFEN